MNIYTVSEYLEDVTFNFHYKTHRKIERLARELDPLLLDINSEYRILVCPHCNIPYSRLYVVVYDDYEVYHRTQFRCRWCNCPLIQKEIGFMETFRCPRCLHTTLKGDGNFVDWD